MVCLEICRLNLGQQQEIAEEKTGSDADQIEHFLSCYIFEVRLGWREVSIMLRMPQAVFCLIWLLKMTHY